MAFWRHYYHLIWATKDRQSLITPEIEKELYNYITSKVISQQCLMYAIGGIENHVHLVVSVPPKLSVAVFVGTIKGSSSHHIEHHLPDLHEKFGWQQGYGSLTFGKKQLEFVVEYVLTQKQYYQQGTIMAGMERDDDTDEGPESLFYPAADMTGYPIKEDETSYDCII